MLFDGRVKLRISTTSSHMPDPHVSGRLEKYPSHGGYRRVFAQLSPDGSKDTTLGVSSACGLPENSLELEIWSVLSLG